MKKNISLEESEHIHCDGRLDGWIDDLQFYVLFNSISVIIGRWADGNERLYAMDLQLKRFHLERGLNSGPLD